MSSVVGIDQLQSIKIRLDFCGKKALVTGAAGGIGRSTSAAIAELGADVALVDINVEAAKTNADYLSRKYGVKAIAVQADVSDPSGVKEMMAAILREFGSVDLVHSNAGVIVSGDNGDLPYEKWKRLLDINLNGMFLVNQAVALWMRDNKRTGAVVNTASMSGHIINRTKNRHMVAYAASKAGVAHLTKGFAADFAKAGIRFNSISPGYMLSGIHDAIPQELLDVLAQDVPLGRFGTMDEIGGAVVFLLSDLATYITGADLLVDGGYTIW